MLEVLNKNEIRLDGRKYELTKGYMDYFGNWNGSTSHYNYNLYITDDGVEIYEDSITGYGNLVLFELWSESPDMLNPGTYSYNEGLAPGTYSFGLLGMKVNFDTGYGYLFYVTEGELEISYDGQEYEFIGYFDSHAYYHFGFYYKGEMTIYDFSQKKDEIKSRHVKKHIERLKDIKFTSLQ